MVVFAAPPSMQRINGQASPCIPELIIKAVEIIPLCVLALVVIELLLITASVLMLEVIIEDVTVKPLGIAASELILFFIIAVVCMQDIKRTFRVLIHYPQGLQVL